MTYLVDVDGTLTKHGEDTLLPGMVDKSREIYKSGHKIWLFTCRPAGGPWIHEFRRQGLWMEGVIQKPFDTEGYVVVDDMLVEGRKTF